MKQQKNLSDAEFAVMDVLWRLGQGTVKEVQGMLAGERTLAYTTVATLLNRLKDKGYVEAQEKNFAYEFHPLIAREQVVRRKLDDLVRQVLGGDIAPLAAYIVRNTQLTPEQIDVLEALARTGEENPHE